MPWLETVPMEQRAQFIKDAQSGLFTMTDLCARYGVSRKTGHKWVARHAEEGRAGLADRSRAPHSCPHRISDEVAELLCSARQQHPTWGPEKLLDWLRKRHPRIAWPAISTAGDLLARRGLVKGRQPRRVHTHPGVISGVTQAPNDLWTADFKGQFRTRDGRWCYPLTLADRHSRFLFTCRGLHGTEGGGVRSWFERVFREYGLPQAIRTDNGSPFATTGLRGLSRLNVWWMRLGIQHQRIQPGQPQQNGAHERMHRTLKQATALPPRANLAAQQRAFDAFRREYNTERPHAALDGDTPAEHYTPSARGFPAALPQQTYPYHYRVYKVSSGGTFRFQRQLLFIGRALAEQHIGLEETDDGIWSIYFSSTLLAKLDERDGQIRG